MGHLSAVDMVEHADFDVALRWHLTSNHYPPLPGGVFTLAKKVIRLANKGKWDSLVNIGSVGLWRGKEKAPVYECVKAWHLDAFLEPQEGN